MRAWINWGVAAAVALAAPGWTPAAAQKDDVAVEGLVVTSRERPAPRIGLGAPMYSPEQTASFVCAAGSNARRLEVAQKAHEATVKAREVRMNPAASTAQMNAAERERQDAVRALNGTDGVVIGGLASLGALLSRGDDDPTTERQGVEVDGIRTSRALENGRAVLTITGRVRNRGKARAELLPLAVSALDANGFSLASQSNLLGKAALEPGESLDFSVRFRNPPQYTATVDVRFSGFFQTRNFRGCDFFDPLIFNPRQIEVAKARAAATPAPMPKVGPGAPPYTAQELAILFPVLLSEAQTAFNADRNEVRCPGAPPPNRHPWRVLFAQSDLAYEAWVATNAAEEIRRDAAMGDPPAGELEAAELKRQEAVNAFVAARPEPLRALSQSASPVRLEGVEVTKGDDGVVRVKGQMRNSGLIPAQPNGLLVTVRDVHGQVVREIPRAPGPAIGGNGALAFSFTLPVRASVVGEVEVAFRADRPAPAPLNTRRKPACPV